MKRISLLSLLPLALVVSCAQIRPYEPATTPEADEYAKDKVNVYPDQVRAHPDLYTNTPVVWVGIIRSSDAQPEDTSNKIRLNTVFEQHYFDWQQQGCNCADDARLRVSGRGEGLFRVRWTMHPAHKYMDSADIEPRDAEKYAAPGKLAVVYGVPEGVEPDGTIDLRYHYIRVLPRKDYSTNLVMYGRMGTLDGR